MNNLHILGLGRAGSIVARQLKAFGVEADYTIIGKPGSTSKINDDKLSDNTGRKTIATIL